MLGFYPVAGDCIAGSGAPVVAGPPPPPPPTVEPVIDPEFDAWLRDDIQYVCTLYEVSVNVGGVETTRYLSNKAYGGGDAATPYLAVVDQDLEVDSSISMDGDAKLTVGSITLTNADGTLDSWLFDVWANRRMAVYVGDVRWQRSSFRQVFAGVVADIAPGQDRGSLVLQFRDILQAMNTSVIEDTLSGNVLRPVIFGEVPNFTPKLKNANTLEYEVNAGAIEDIPEARVDGKPREITKNLAVGSFTLDAAVGPGTLTCDVQGDKGDGTYHNTIATTVQRLVTGYGTPATRLTAGDIDTDNFTQFDASCPQPIGLALDARTNVLVACAQLASSKGAQLIPSRLGKLRLIQYAIPTAATTEIHPSSQIGMKLTPLPQRPFQPQAAVLLGYCQNYTPEANLQTSIPADNKQMLALQWRTVTSVDAGVQAMYRLSAVPPTQKNTCLLALGDAQAEADRLRDIVKVPRLTYSFDGTPDTILIELGQGVMLFNPRFELANGKPGLVTRVKANFGTLQTTIEVTI